MPKKELPPEEIVEKPKQVDVLLWQGRPGVGSDRREQGDAVQTLSMAKGVSRAEVRSGETPKDIEKENERLRKAVCDLSLDTLIPKGEASSNASGN